MFIILTGENWNEVMILVISNMKSFTPAYLFIFMMLLGNFMLLNLFLAILLKRLSMTPAKRKLRYGCCRAKCCANANVPHE